MKKTIKGLATFVTSKSGVGVAFEGLVSVEREVNLINGLEFLKQVDSEEKSYRNGRVSIIYVDDHASNLGLYFKGIQTGGFVVLEDIFEEICNKYKVEVDWESYKEV